MHELGQYKSEQTITILRKVMMRDSVYKVQYLAFLKLQAFGENVKAPRKRKGNLVKDIQKKLRAIHDEFESAYTFEDFKSVFKKKHPSAYDTYEGDKEDRFDKWLTNVISNFPKK